MEEPNPIDESKARAKVTYTNIIIAAVVVAVVVLLAFPNLIERQKPKESYVQGNLARLSIGLQKFAEVHDGYYPLRMIELFEWDPEIAPQMYDNPFTEQKMREIAFKDSPFAGEYTYVPYVQDGKACGLYLIVYGAEYFDGVDVDEDGTPDHVLQVLGSDGSTSPYLNVEIWPPLGKCPLPPLKKLLRAQKNNPQTQSTASPEEVR
jgi:hypothetical protein